MYLIIIGQYSINAEKLRVFFAWQAKAQTKYADLASTLCKDFVPKKDQQRFTASQYIACVHAWDVGVGVGNWQFLLDTEQLLTYFQAAHVFF